MKERDFQTLFNHYLNANWKLSAALELKLVKRKRFNFNQIAEHQLRNLYNAKHGIITYKIDDSGYGQKPFDSFVLYHVPAYVVIMFYKPRAQKKFYMLDIDVVQGQIDDGRKSITEEEAEKLCDRWDYLKK